MSKFLGIKKVNTYCLKLEWEKEQYEKLINDPTHVVVDEQFTYTKSGEPLITVWYYDSSKEYEEWAR